MEGLKPFVNCVSYGSCGTCLHQAAPRGWFGAARCIMFFENKDPRVLKGCALQTKSPRPNPPSAMKSPKAVMVNYDE